MHQLEVSCKRGAWTHSGEHFWVISLIVDGRAFSELVGEFEAPFSGELAGDYKAMHAGYYDEDFLFGRKPDYGYRTELLGCTCGTEGCWPLAACIREDGDQVTWSDFAQPHRKHWDYSGFGPFVFNRRQYLEAIQPLLAAQREPGTWPPLDGEKSWRWVP